MPEPEFSPWPRHRLSDSPCPNSPYAGNLSKKGNQGVKKSETKEAIEFISSLRSNLRHLFPMNLTFDSTGDKPELKPLRARPLQRWLLIIGSFLLSGLWILLVHFNLGILVSVPTTIGLLWAFAMLRDLPPAPMKVEIRFWSDGSLYIKSDSASVSLNEVGPIWVQDGLLFALAHDYQKQLDTGGKHAAAILPVLRGRASKLGVDNWNPSDIQDPRKEMLPGEWEKRDKMDEGIRSLYRPLLEQTPGKATPVPILLGRLMDADDAESSSQDRKSLVAISFICFMNLYEKTTLVKEQCQETAHR